MKYKIIITVLLIALGAGSWGILEYKKYLDFLDLYDEGSYAEILQQNLGQSPEMLHNYGQVAFKSYVESDFTQPSFLQLSNQYFSGSLNIQKNIDTQYWYDITSKLLQLYDGQDIDELEQEMQQGGQEGTSEDSRQGESGEDSQQSGSAQNGRDSEYYLNSRSDTAPLTQAEKRELERNIEELKQDQIQNQKFYGKQEQSSPFQEAFESIFGDIERGGEKDW